jgi:hypothetical protein
VDLFPEVVSDFESLTISDNAERSDNGPRRDSEEHNNAWSEFGSAHGGPAYPPSRRDHGLRRRSGAESEDSEVTGNVDGESTVQDSISAGNRIRLATSVAPKDKTPLQKRSDTRNGEDRLQAMGEDRREAFQTGNASGAKIHDAALQKPWKDGSRLRPSTPSFSPYDATLHFSRSQGTFARDDEIETAQASRSDSEATVVDRRSSPAETIETLETPRTNPEHDDPSIQETFNDAGLSQELSKMMILSPDLRGRQEPQGKPRAEEVKSSAPLPSKFRAGRDGVEHNGHDKGAREGEESAR